MLRDDEQRDTLIAKVQDIWNVLAQSGERVAKAPAPAPSPSDRGSSKKNDKNKTKDKDKNKNNWPPCETWAMTGECAGRNKGCKKAHPWSIRNKGKNSEWDSFVTSLATDSTDQKPSIARDFKNAPKKMVTYQCRDCEADVEEDETEWTGPAKFGCRDGFMTTRCFECRAKNCKKKKELKAKKNADSLPVEVDEDQVSEEPEAPEEPFCALAQESALMHSDCASAPSPVSGQFDYQQAAREAASRAASANSTMVCVDSLSIDVSSGDYEMPDTALIEFHDRYVSNRAYGFDDHSSNDLRIAPVPQFMSDQDYQESIQVMSCVTNWCFDHSFEISDILGVPVDINRVKQIVVSTIQLPPKFKKCASVKAVAQEIVTLCRMITPGQVVSGDVDSCVLADALFETAQDTIDEAAANIMRYSLEIAEAFLMSIYNDFEFMIAQNVLEKFHIINLVCTAWNRSSKNCQGDCQFLNRIRSMTGRQPSVTEFASFWNSNDSFPALSPLECNACDEISSSLPSNIPICDLMAQMSCAATDTVAVANCDSESVSTEYYAAVLDSDLSDATVRTSDECESPDFH
jgi:hypothetical protein